MIFLIFCVSRRSWASHCQQRWGSFILHHRQPRGSFGSPFFFFFLVLLLATRLAIVNKAGTLAPLFCFFSMLLGETRPTIINRGGAIDDELRLSLFLLCFVFLMLLGVVGPSIANRRGSFGSPFFLFFVLVGIVLHRNFAPCHCQ